MPAATITGACTQVKKSITAALLSALVFPGVGHIYLKNYRPGIALAGVAFVATAYSFSIAAERALHISEAIQSGALPLDIEAVTRMASEQAGDANVHWLNVAIAAFCICWLIGVVDAYRLGRRRDRAGPGRPDGKA